MEQTLFNPLRSALLRRLVALVCLLPALALANPAGETIRFGDVDFVRNGNRLDVIQHSNKAIIDWTSFSIANGETTDFSQPGAAAAALNRVTGVSASQIDGLLRSSGRILLLNPNGIVIGPNGRVDTASFVASTLDLSDGDFLAGGDLPLKGASEASVINLGTISAFDGDVFLVAAAVENHGSIFAPNGTVGLAAGNDVLIRESGEERVWVRGASGEKKETGVVNTGTVEANVAELKSYNGNIYGMAVKNEGRVAATGVTKQGGQIFLSAGGGKSKIRNTGTLVAKNPTTQSDGKISIRNSGAESLTEVGGTVDAGSSEPGGVGGDVVILGTRIDVLPDTVILADGENGGGRIQIGGGRRGENPDFNNAEFVSVGNGVEINASATANGDGGEVILFATDTLDFYGHASVRGGDLSGDGGFVELSGKRRVNFNGFVNAANTRAVNGANGSLLFDPIDVVIHAGTGSTGTEIIGDTVNSRTDLYAGDIAAYLQNSGNLEIRTDGGESGVGDIRIVNSADISWTGTNDLKLFADGSISMEDDSLISSGMGDIHFENVRGSNNDGITGTYDGIALTNDASIVSTGGNITLIGTGNADGIGRSSGVFMGMDTSISTGGDGNITIRGTGGLSDSSNVAVGVQIGMAGISTENGDITIEGTGAGDYSDTGNSGVTVGLSSLSSTGGDIKIKGTGGFGSSGNTGVFIAGYTMETVTGNIEIEGTGGVGDNSDGVRIESSTVRTRDGGTITISGRAYAPEPKIESTAETEIITTFVAVPDASNGVSMDSAQIDSHSDLTVSGDGDNDVGVAISGTTMISDTGRLQLDGKSNDHGAVHIGDIAATSIELVSRGGDVTIESTGGIDAGSLVLRDESTSGADYMLDSGSIDIGSVTTESTIGSLSLVASDRFTVSSVDATGNLNFEAPNAITFTGGTHTNGNITVASTVINVTGDLSADGNFDSTHDTTGFSAHEFNLTGSIFATTTTFTSGYVGGTFNVDGGGLAGSDIRFTGDVGYDIINVDGEFDLNKIKFSGLEEINGVGSNSSLLGLHSDQTYLIQNNNEVVNDGFTFSGFDNLRTGQSSDTIMIATGATGGPFIDDTGGIDRLIAASGVNDVFDIDEDNEGTLNGIFEFAGIEILDANSGDDEFIVRSAATSEQFMGGSGFDRVTAYGAYEIGSVLLDSVEEIRGGGNNDILASPNFEPVAGTVAGNDQFTLTSDGDVRHSGINYLDFEQVWTGAGNDTFTVEEGFASAIRLRSFGGTDTLQAS
ncbi:MAG: filamentous hemagglutinin N-terminal domain-containing protein, partial [Verrucomicrobiales bacterium]|nr:filamentous hemagglutinin N-terminal domain-containing protein [Verrucomicrobiales bacterium]